jgi:hypothetical protein
VCDSFYVVPPSAKLVQTSLAERWSHGFAAIAASLIALPAVIAALPFALSSGIAEATKKDGYDGSGTFLKGFSDMLRLSTGWFARPLGGLYKKMVMPPGPFFVDRKTDPTRTILTVRVRMVGDQNTVSQMKQLEPLVEAHLASPGYLVNLEFVDEDRQDAVTIPLDPTAWPNAAVWNPMLDGSVEEDDIYTTAHELMHNPLGLPDEYNIQAHFVNKKMSLSYKLGLAFFYAAAEPMPADAAQGIMYNHRLSPLARHYKRILGQR